MMGNALKLIHLESSQVRPFPDNRDTPFPVEHTVSMYLLQSGLPRRSANLSPLVLLGFHVRYSCTHFIPSSEKLRLKARGLKKSHIL